MIAKALSRFYLWFWFHTEFWLTRTDRRPYTFIMRDWAFRHQIPALIIWAALVGLLVWAISFSLWWTIGYSLFWLLLGHLFWGSEWIEGEQEYPEHLG